MKYIQPHWPAPQHIKAYTTVRSSWGTRQPHHDVNETYTEEESQQLENLLQLPNAPLWVTQKHTAIAIQASVENKRKIADATFTNERQQVCIVITADCLPILICDQRGTEVAAIHAGWRGLAAGIIENTVAQLRQSPENLLVWLGPAIGPTKFEVGNDVYDVFVNKNTINTAAFTEIGYKNKEQKWLANLYKLATIRLQQQGITRIYGGDFCTYTQEELFFSYRRDQKKTGRMASVIWINN